MTPTDHICEDSFDERIATHAAPYHYVGSGLSNVFLTGIKYYVCQVCGMQAAEIPALKELLKELARTIVQKETPLKGEEIRFLRKRVSKKATEFAGMLSFTPEHYSKIETETLPVSDQSDRLIRLIYGFLSGDKKLKLAIEKKFEQWITGIQGTGQDERIFAARVKRQRNQWIVEAESAAA